MDPTTRVLLIGQDVTVAMTAEGIVFNNDLTKKFGSDLQMNLGAFETLLTRIQTTINKDPSLHLVKNLNWKKLPGDQKSGQTFAEYFLSSSINDLIICFDAVISHSPYEA